MINPNFVSRQRPYGEQLMHPGAVAMPGTGTLFGGYLGGQNSSATTGPSSLPANFYGTLSKNLADTGRTGAQQLIPGQFDILKHLQDFYGQHLPGLFAGFNTLFGNLMNPGSMASQERAGVMGQAGEQGNNLAQQLATTGGGIGVQEGARLHAFNQGNETANNFQNQLFSPQGQMDRGQALAQLMQMISPNYNPLQQLQSIIQTKDAPQPSSDPLGSLLGAGIGAAITKI